MFLSIITVFVFFAHEHFIFRWCIFAGYAASIFPEAYYFSEHAFRIYCIARGACPEELKIWEHKLMYFRALLAAFTQTFAVYLDLYLLLALGVCSDRKELLIRNLDEYGVRRPRKFAIYDITKTNKPYYASLKENVAEDEESLRKKYVLLKEGEERKKAGRAVYPLNEPEKDD